jgi:hypothetical protein
LSLILRLPISYDSSPFLYPETNPMERFFVVARLRGNVRLILLSTLFVFLVPFRSIGLNPPDEGMWLPLLVERLNYIDMKKMGLHLTPDELYSINHSSLKDAIVGLSTSGANGGFFCTAEVVSGEGLIFTNHHCGFDAVQNHSTPEHDYLTTGFWAKSREEELPNENFCASFLVRMENVTDSILPFLSDTMSESDRNAKIREISNRLRSEASEKDKYEVSVKDFFGGNEFYLFVYLTYRDVRLAGAPPLSIGKFGGETDNWMWPRHTGDFTVFRIYTDPDGNPATYAEKNIPLKPKYHLPININGFKRDEFAMIWGFPGRTSRYLTSYGVSYNIAELYPTIVKIFGKELEIMKSRMDADKQVDIDYATKYARIANTWKNFIGQEKMLQRNHVVEKKQGIEAEFTTWFSKDPAREKMYGDVLPSLKEGYAEMARIATPFYYVSLAGLSQEIVGFTMSFNDLASSLEKKNKAAVDENVKVLKEEVKDHFREKDLLIEKETFAALLQMYAQDVPENELPSIFATIRKDYNNNFNAFADRVFTKSIFATEQNAMAFLSKPSLKKLQKDLVWQTAKSMNATRNQYMLPFGKLRSDLGMYNRLFIAGLRQEYPDSVFYPDANSTMRVTYGKVLDYYPADAVHYDYYTTLKGVMEKEDPSNPEFYVEPRLKDLFRMKDYGPYGEDGKLVTCFITTNDITGGNSGSPVINGDGQLIGIAFDGNWEAMSGDISFEPRLQRTINVDIRYVLFIIDKFAGDTNLINELTLEK